jgi:hypothetical protein
MRGGPVVFYRPIAKIRGFPIDVAGAPVPRGRWSFVGAAATVEFSLRLVWRRRPEIYRRPTGERIDMRSLDRRMITVF